jgi:hypothetical protein
VTPECRGATARDRGDDPALLRAQAAKPIAMVSEDVRDLRAILLERPGLHGSALRRLDARYIGQKIVEGTPRVTHEGLGHVGVDLRRPQAPMAEQALNHPDVHTSLEKVSREGMAKRMR